ncbi:MAG: hypothetical protein V3V84_00750 [Candidatus Bathyarchaeia archaeon]
MPDLAQCNLEFLNTLKGVLGANDGKSVIKTLNDRANELKENGLSENEAITQATKELSDRTKELGQLRTRQQLINIKKYKAIKDFVFSFKDPARGLHAILGGIEGSLIKGSKNSVNSFQRSVTSDLLSSFEKEIEELGLKDAYRDKNTHIDIFKEIYTPDSTGNLAATKIAKLVKEMWGKGRAMLNERGGAVGDLNEYVGRQVHNPERMLKLSDNWIEHKKALRDIKKLSSDRADRIVRLKTAAYQKWKNFILPRLDQARTFKGSDPEKFLRKVFDNIVDGNYDTNKGGDFEGDFKFTGPGNYAKKISQRRLIHFKDGQGSFEYNEKYGSGSMFGMISKTVEGMGKNIGLLEKLGTNPRSMFERIAKEVKADGGSRLSLWRAENLYKEVSGEIHSVVDNMFAKAFIGARLVQTMAKLGGVTLSAIPDVGLMADQLRANGMGWLESESKAFFGTLKGITKEEKVVSDLLGVYFESITQQMMHQYSTIDSEFGALSKVAQQSYKLFGITQFDEIKRRTIGTLLSRNLAVLKDTKWVSLNKQLKQSLLEHGIEEKEWNLMRKTENINIPYQNKQFVTPQDPSAYSLNSIKEYLGKEKPTSREIKEVRDDMEFNLRSYFLNNTANVNMLPGAVERAWMHMGTDPNTPLGQVVRAIMQFKGFALSMSRRKLGRFYGHILENGFHWNDVMSDTGHFVQMAISLYGYGYLALAMKDLVSGKVPRDPRDLKTTISAMLQGGFAGLYGDFLLGNYKRGSGESFTESLEGPTLSTVNQAAELFSRLKSMDHPGTAAFYLIKNNTPFLNLWYAKAAFNYLFLYGIQDKISPGSLERMQSNLRRNHGQHFMFDPSTHAMRFR